MCERRRRDDAHPLVEIIVPVYNVEPYLERCVDSILAQDYGNIRVWLVDDGSTDGCPRICDRYAESDRRVRVIHRTNGGIAAARNTGLDAIFRLGDGERGSFIAWVDSDDRADSDFVAFLVALQEDTGADVVQCGHRIVYSESRSVEASPERPTEVLGREQALESLLRNKAWDVTLWNKLFSADLFEGLRFEEGRNYEDTEISFRIAARCKRVAVNMAPKYSYDQRYTSIANGRSWSPRKLDLVWAGDRMAAWAEANHPRLRSAAAEKRAFVRLSTLSQMVNTGHDDRVLAARLRREVMGLAPAVLRDREASARVKLGILAIACGWRAYRALWGLCYRVTRRR